MDIPFCRLVLTLWICWMVWNGQRNDALALFGLLVSMTMFGNLWAARTVKKMMGR